MDPLAPGSLFAGRYRVQHEIARGGMGVVYAAEHVETEQDVALKVIFGSIGASTSAMEGFKNEARIAARLDGEHVVRVLDAGIDPETRFAFLTMELLAGQTVASVLEARGSLPPAEVADIFRDLGRALDRAHHHRDKSGTLRPIVHRDLKPENLFLVDRGDGEHHLKVLDFGLAKIVSHDDQVSGGIKGTPLYMAYEQLAGRPVTPRTDVWALGLVAFRLLTGKHYWRAANDRPVPPTRLFAEVLHEPMPPASARAEALGVPASLLPDGFDAWFARCVARFPEDRFETARGATDELRRLLGSAVTEVRRPAARPSMASGGGATAETARLPSPPLTALEAAATVRVSPAAPAAPAAPEAAAPAPASSAPSALVRGVLWLVGVAALGWIVVWFLRRG